MKAQQGKLYIEKRGQVQPPIKRWWRMAQQQKPDLATDHGAVTLPTWLNAKDRLHKVTQWEGKRGAGGKKCLAYAWGQLQRHLPAPCITAGISQAFPGWIQARNTPAAKPGTFVFSTTLVCLCFLPTALCKSFCSVLHLTYHWQLGH